MRSDTEMLVRESSMASKVENTSYVPIKLWPPVPADRYGKRPCQARQGKGVDYASCTDTNTSIQSRLFCNGCACEWRVCTVCSVQHDRSDEIRNIDPKTGLCPFHASNGRDAKRPPALEEIPRYRKLDMSVLSSRPAVVSEEGEDDSSTATSTDSANSNTPAASTSEEERLSEYALGIRTFVPRQKLIIKYLGEGMSRQQIAEILKSKAGTINITLLQMAAVLGIPHDGMGSKADYMASVFARIHQHAIKKSMNEKPDV